MDPAGGRKTYTAAAAVPSPSNRPGAGRQPRRTATSPAATPSALVRSPTRSSVMTVAAVGQAATHHSGPPRPTTGTAADGPSAITTASRVMLATVRTSAAKPAGGANRWAPAPSAGSAAVAFVRTPRIQPAALSRSAPALKLTAAGTFPQGAAASQPFRRAPRAAVRPHC